MVFRFDKYKYGAGFQAPLISPPHVRGLTPESKTLLKRLGYKLKK